MKKHTQFLLMLLLGLSLAGCGNKPLDKKYNSKTIWYDIRLGSNAKNDSLNHELCGQATAENNRHGKKNEDFTYQELIDQGYKLLRKAHSEAYVDSLREVYGN